MTEPAGPGVTLCLRWDVTIVQTVTGIGLNLIKHAVLREREREREGGGVGGGGEAQRRKDAEQINYV